MLTMKHTIIHTSHTGCFSLLESHPGHSLLLCWRFEAAVPARGREALPLSPHLQSEPQHPGGSRRGAAEPRCRTLGCELVIDTIIEMLQRVPNIEIWKKKKSYLISTAKQRHPPLQRCFKNSAGPSGVHIAMATTQEHDLSKENCLFINIIASNFYSNLYWTVNE